MSIEICYGRWFGSLVFVTRDRLESFAKADAALRLILRSEDWGPVLTEFPLQELEALLAPTLDIAWHNQDPYPDEGRPELTLPPLKSFDDGYLAEYGGLQYLNDSEADPDLPEEVAEYASYPETSPMTGYEPWEWRERDVAAVHRAAELLGITVTDESDRMLALSEPL